MPGRIRLSALILSVVALGAFALVADFRPEAPRARACPPGFISTTYEEVASELGGLPEPGNDRQAHRAGGRYCLNASHPESFMEMRNLAAQWGAKLYAPFAGAPPRAYSQAVQQREAIVAAAPRVRGANSQWLPYGRGPLIANDSRFPSVNGNGFVELAGRVDSLDYDPQSGRLFAVIGTGGLWMSEDMGGSWRSIGDGLPSQILGAVAWTPARGGRLVVVGGEHLQGGNTYTGTGAFWSKDLGKTWTQAKGVPAGILGFQVAVDPTDGKVVYVATSKGLFRSENAGVDFQNVNLPTGPCAGNTGNQECLLANFVTDVVVQSPDTFGNAGGTVLAAVGYRSGDRAFPHNTSIIESPENGLYRSDTGQPGTFTKLAATGFTPETRIGRVELGVADGPAQNHDYVYAIVQDSELFNGGVQTIDAPEESVGAPNSTSINGIYVSANFGESWTQMANTNQIAFNPTTGSALFAVSALIAPGVQAWYNEWIKVDPTRATATGIPTRINFGLEEVWENKVTAQPQNGLSEFKVIGRYFSTESCILGVGGNITCPPNPLVPTTTHPDQHDAIWVPDGQGGATLVVGNDGGVYTQHVGPNQELSQANWGPGANNGFHTLLPYSAEMSGDGTVWYGLQDNGTGKIEGSTQQQYMTFGGDGTFVMTDPNNSAIAYSSTPSQDIRVTTNGGTDWREQYWESNFFGGLFVNPFVMDPRDPNHLMTGTEFIEESIYGPDTGQTDQANETSCLSECPAIVFDLTTENPDNHLSALDLEGSAAYVGYCGPCALLNVVDDPFRSGIATNIGGAQPPQPMTEDGWHFAAAQGLPERYINAVEIDPNDPRTVYVALGGYENRQWRPPGSFGDPNAEIGRGHVFVSHDAGETFQDISANLPDAPAFALQRWRNQLVVGTQVGTFLSRPVGTLDRAPKRNARWAALDKNMPNVPVVSLDFRPNDPDLLVAGTYGRGVYTVDLGGCGKKAAARRGTQIVGSQIADRLRGGRKRDVICGKGGSDRISGKRGNDLLIGGGGKKTRDRLNGGGGNDLLRGQGGRDILKGGAGRDRLIGGGGRDVCFVGPGDVARGCERKRSA